MASVETRWMANNRARAVVQGAKTRSAIHKHNLSVKPRRSAHSVSARCQYIPTTSSAKTQCLALLGFAARIDR
jgi:hypothetical protein